MPARLVKETLVHNGGESVLGIYLVFNESITQCTTFKRLQSYLKIGDKIHKCAVTMLLYVPVTNLEHDE